MRTIPGAVMAALSLAGPVLAQDDYDWAVLGDPEGGAAVAVGCLPGEFEQIFTSLCVSIGCDAGEAPSLGLGIQQVPLPPETRVTIAVDDRGVADFVLPVDLGGHGGEVPLAGLDALVEALRTGKVAQVSVATYEGPRVYALPLRRSREAIDAALGACPLAASELLPETGRPTADPGAEAIAGTRVFRDSGFTTVEPDLVRHADVEGGAFHALD